MDLTHTRDEPAGTVRARLAGLGVNADLPNLDGWQRSIVYDALEVAHQRDLADHGTLAGARYLQELADTYRRVSNRPEQVAAVLDRCATGYIHR